MKCLTCQEALRLLHVIYGSQEDVPELLAGVMVSFSCLPFYIFYILYILYFYILYSPITNHSFSSFLIYYIKTNKEIKRYY